MQAWEMMHISSSKTSAAQYNAQVDKDGFNAVILQTPEIWLVSHAFCSTIADNGEFTAYECCPPPPQGFITLFMQI